MRADRLLSILMLLQSRGQMTAEQLAGELEVSRRTIYRDIDALCVAGVPIYADRGIGGGYALLDSYRTSLTGLNDGEVRALFMLSIPAPLADLGVGQALRSALLKLSAALPDGRRQDETLVRQRVHLDSVSWFQPGEPVPYLRTIQQAVWKDRRLYLTYKLPFETVVERLVDPYGLVAKTDIWYVVYGWERRLQARRVSEVVGARLSEETFERPADFDLTAFWESWCATVEANRPQYPVQVLVSPALMPYLPYHFGPGLWAQFESVGSPDEAGWIPLTLVFETFEQARRGILGLGRSVQVLAPEALRLSVLDFARQIVELYEGKGPPQRPQE